MPISDSEMKKRNELLKRQREKMAQKFSTSNVAKDEKEVVDFDTVDSLLKEKPSSGERPQTLPSKPKEVPVKNRKKVPKTKSRKVVGASSTGNHVQSEDKKERLLKFYFAELLAKLGMKKEVKEIEISVSQVMNCLGVSRNTARSYLTKWENIGVIKLTRAYNAEEQMGRKYKVL